MGQDLNVEEDIHLHNAVMIIGLGGWGNAGEVSTFSVKYLVDKLNAKKFGEIRCEGFHDYFIQRPVVSIERGIMQSYITPENSLFYSRKEGRADLVLLLGYEPHLNWPGYAGAVLRLAEEQDVRRIYTMGGYLADISHESETPISGSTNNGKLVSELEKAGIELTNYNGPTSVYSEIMWRAKEENLGVISLWCAVPMYSTGPYPKAAMRMLNKLEQLIGIELDLKDLEEKAETFQKQFERESRGERQPRDMLEALRGRRGLEKEPSYIF